MQANVNVQQAPVAVVTQAADDSIYGFEVKTIDGATQKMAAYKGQVLLIVNVASHCGFTPQYEGLEALYDKYQARGFQVLGFPLQQFRGARARGRADNQKLLLDQVRVSFPMFSKIDVNGKK